MTYKLPSILFLLLPLSLLSTSAIAQSPSGDWNGNYNFSGPGGNSSRLLQADLIERKDNGYYDSFGPGNLTVNNFLTNTVGTLNSYTTTIDGEGNSVVNDSTAYNYGNLNGSINVISNSLLNTTESSSNTISSTNEFID